MSSTTTPDLADLARRLIFVDRCTETRPENILTEADGVLEVISHTTAALWDQMDKQGFARSSADALILPLEAMIYDYILKCNADRGIFSTIEFFGENIDTPDGPAMLARTKAAVDAFDPANIQVIVSDGQ